MVMVLVNVFPLQEMIVLLLLLQLVMQLVQMQEKFVVKRQVYVGVDYFPVLKLVIQHVMESVRIQEKDVNF